MRDITEVTHRKLRMHTADFRMAADPRRQKTQAL